MAFFNPANLAHRVCDQWSSVPLAREKPAPIYDQLVQIVEAAYCASMYAEEGRPVRFRLILLRSDEVVEQEHMVARFSEPRPLSASEIRRLAPATELSSAFIAIEQSDEGWCLWGTIEVGSAWTLFQRGESSSGIGLPANIVITARGPGTLSIGFSDFHLFGVEHSQEAIPSSNVLKFGPMREFFQPSLFQLLRIAFPDMDESSFDNHFIISYAGEYLRFLSRTLRYVEELAHGGTVIVVREEDTGRLREFVSIKYEIVNLDIWKEMTRNLQLIAEEIETEKSVSGKQEIDQQCAEVWRTAMRGLKDSNQRLADTSRFLARLTQVDGALILTDALKVLGFGAVIGDLSDMPATVKVCHDETCKKFNLKKIDDYGTRHRSAIKLCHSVDIVSFVISQDGGVKAFRRVDGEVLLWPSVSLDPSAWFPTSLDVIPALRDRYLNRNA